MKSLPHVEEHSFETSGLVDSFPENLSSSPFIIEWKSEIN